MAEFKSISPHALTGNVFETIGDQWMLVTAQDGQRINTMTASWGGEGIMWNKPAVFLTLRPQRYTREMVDAADSFSLSFFDESFRKQLQYCGAVTGRDEDKIAATGFDVIHDGDTPYFQQASTVLICRKLYRTYMQPEDFIDKDLIPKFYPAKDHHYLYIAEITNVLVK